MTSKLDELNKLEMLLRYRNVPYERIERKAQEMFDWDRHQIVIPSDDDRIWSIICHWGSYGYNEGLLELYGPMNDGDKCDVYGYLTAEEAMNKMFGSIWDA